MEQNEANHPSEHDGISSGDSIVPARQIVVGDIHLHQRFAEEVEFTHAYRAIRRHEMGEVQEGLPESLRIQAEAESRAYGLVVSYHCAPNGKVFGVVTHPLVGSTFVRFAPLDDLHLIANVIDCK